MFVKATGSAKDVCKCKSGHVGDVGMKAADLQCRREVHGIFLITARGKAKSSLSRNELRKLYRCNPTQHINS